MTLKYLRNHILLSNLFIVCCLSPAFAVAPATGVQSKFTVPHVSAQILVKRADTMSTNDLQQLLNGYSPTIITTAVAGNIDLLEINDDSELENAINLLSSNPGIIFAEPNYLHKLDATPNDIDFSQQWSKNNTGINAPDGLGNPSADLNLVNGWNLQTTANGITIAIIDDSLETTHIDLLGNVLNTGRCFASANSPRPCTNGANDPNPADNNDFHGTLVAGVAAARGNNGTGIAGAAWETNILPLKVDLSSFAITQAVDEAIAQNADIINMSFGGPVESRTLSEAIARSEKAGLLVIASSGNADANNDIATHYPSGSDSKNLLSIASTNSRDRVSGFSQWGSLNVDLAAPGERVRTTSNGNNFSIASGTSFSAPHVAGIAALIKQSSGAADYRQIKAQLLNGTVIGNDALGPVTPGQDQEAVPGRVATGRLDAATALQAATRGVLLVSDITIDDSNSGNDNGVLDPGESALLTIQLSNYWVNENNVVGTLTASDSGAIIVNESSPVSFGNLDQDNSNSATFNVSLSTSVTGNQQYFLELALSSSNGILNSRYFYLEVGTLSNGTTITQQLQRNNFDEFQAFRIDVPTGASNLLIQTQGSGDVDLLARFGQSPEYLISLDTSANEGFYYVDSDSEVSAQGNANESITIANPVAGTYHIVLVNFDQQSKSVDITASFDAPTTGGIAFELSSYSVSEADGMSIIGVSRTGGVGGASVSYQAFSQTAIEGDDFTPTSGTLIWGLGENSVKTFNIPITDDSLLESTETLEVRLTNVIGSTSNSPQQATVEILDDDSQPNSSNIAFAESTYQVTEGDTTFNIIVTRTGSSSGAASVDFNSINGQATASSDYSAVSGTLSWLDGEDGNRSINIPITDDNTEESIEEFIVQISNVQGANLGSIDRATISINDDDDNIVNEINPPTRSGGGGSFGYYWLVIMLLSYVARTQSSVLIRSKIEHR